MISADTTPFHESDERKVECLEVSMNNSRRFVSAKLHVDLVPISVSCTILALEWTATRTHGLYCRRNGNQKQLNFDLLLLCSFFLVSSSIPHMVLPIFLLLLLYIRSLYFFLARLASMYLTCILAITQLTRSLSDIDHKNTSTGNFQPVNLFQRLQMFPNRRIYPWDDSITLVTRLFLCSGLRAPAVRWCIGLL